MGGRSEGAMECLVTDGAEVVVTRVPHDCGVLPGKRLKHIDVARELQQQLTAHIGGTLEVDLGGVDCLPVSSPYFLGGRLELHEDASNASGTLIAPSRALELALFECCSVVSHAPR